MLYTAKHLSLITGCSQQDIKKYLKPTKIGGLVRYELDRWGLYSLISYVDVCRLFKEDHDR